MTDIDLVLFDLGGVLVEFGGVEAMKSMSGISDDEELWARWLTCRWVREFERGGCTASEFAAGMVADWELAITPDEYLVDFGSWLKGPLAGAQELVDDTRTVAAVGCLSNTNSVHADEVFARWPLVAELEYRLFSHEIGIVKPDREVFDQAARQVGVAPARILFLDDNQLNVDGARDAGFVAQRARGVDEARRALVAEGVLG